MCVRVCLCLYLYGICDLSLPSPPVIFLCITSNRNPNLKHACRSLKCYRGMSFNGALHRSLSGRRRCGRICGNLELENQLSVPKIRATMGKCQVSQSEEVNEKVCNIRVFPSRSTTFSSHSLTASALCGSVGENSI